MKQSKVRWYHWSVVRLAGFAMLTVFIGFIMSALTAVQSIDQLLHIVHDDDVESSLRYGMEQAKVSYTLKQEILVEKLKHKVDTKKLNSETLDAALITAGAASILGSPKWKIRKIPPVPEARWENRRELAFYGFLVEFGESTASESFHKVEEVLQRYKLIGLDLQNRIRPALIRSLSVTLGIMCLMLIASFVVMAARVRGRIQVIVDGFENYADGAESFRFKHRWQSELGLISQQFNRMADELASNRV
ncbi:MAG: hypothetical protein NTV34_01825, partial [Proteobacteria bacterium]|nr:hypothetical protein [Pseudomonadota bacterium]